MGLLQPQITLRAVTVYIRSTTSVKGQTCKGANIKGPVKKGAIY